jgi:HK97 family phage prohead protease
MKPKMKTNKVFKFASSFKANETEDGTIKIAGLASTTDIDRVGDVILSSAWDNGGIENFKKNPIILYNHNHSKPIGRATSLSVSEKGLALEAKISSADKEIQQLIKDGVLSTFSVGFRIKDADYIEETDGLKIKDVELYEVSVVSIPCNQNATFNLSKAFDSEEEKVEYLKQFKQPAEETAEDSANVQDSAGNKAHGDETPEVTENEMTPEEIQKMIDDGIKAGLEKAEATRLANEEAVRQEKEKEEKLNVQITTATERLIGDLEKRLSEKDANLEKVLGEFKTELTEKSEELEALKKSKRVFADRGENVDEAELVKEAEGAYLLGVVTGKGWNTRAGKLFAEKTAGNPGGGVAVPNLESWETLVSTSIERDIQHELVLAPLFREIQMNSAVMKFPVLPDAGYAEFTAQNTDASGSAYKGNLATRGDTYGSPYGGVDLTERVLTVKNIKSVSYLGNEVEEDAIMPIMPLIRESIIRSHARTVENSILMGGYAAGGITGAFDGLVEIAKDNTKEFDLATGATPATVDAADLLSARRLMGKYGMRPSDVVYIVSEAVYFDLMEDAEWQDISQVGPNDSMKLKGAVGKIYGSEVIVCDEFPAVAVEVPCGVVVNRRNFLIPRLRGLTVEAEYKAVEQRRAVIATQRLGFAEIISGASAVASILYGPAA